MEEKDITANMARETIARQSNEDEVTAVFRLYILRFWSRERIENFCLNLLGVDVHEYRAWRQAVEQSVQADEVPECDCNTAQGFHEDSCAVTIFYAALRR